MLLIAVIFNNYVRKKVTGAADGGKRSLIEVNRLSKFFAR